MTDEQILDMQKLLAKLEGIWVEPASAAGLAGLAAEIESGTLRLRSGQGLKVEGKRIVAICTGHGMKDPDIIAQSMPTSPSAGPPGRT